MSDEDSVLDKYMRLEVGNGNQREGSGCRIEGDILRVKGAVKPFFQPV